MSRSGDVAPEGTPDAVYQLRVVLGGISPLIWRRLLVLGSTTLTGLHEILQTAFDWEGDYLHEFTVQAVTYGTIASAHRRGDGVRLVDLGLRERERFAYVYNFFAGWRHDLRVEKIGPLQPRRRYPHCLAGARRAPPDGCDGPAAYLHLRGQQFSALIRIAEIFDELYTEHLDDRFSDIPELMDELRDLQVFTRLDGHFNRKTVNTALLNL